MVLFLRLLESFWASPVSLLFITGAWFCCVPQVMFCFIRLYSVLALAYSRRMCCSSAVQRSVRAYHVVVLFRGGLACPFRKIIQSSHLLRGRAAVVQYSPVYVPIMWSFRDGLAFPCRNISKSSHLRRGRAAVVQYNAMYVPHMWLFGSGSVLLFLVEISLKVLCVFF